MKFKVGFVSTFLSVCALSFSVSALVPEASAAVAALTPTTIADIAQAVSPSVVNIEVDQAFERNGGGLPFFEFPFGDSPFEYFFNGQKVRPTPNRNGGPAQPSNPSIHKLNTGSGFIIRPDGFIMTNAHVVKGANKIKVSLSDKRVFDGKVIGLDGYTDLAVIKIDATNLPTLKLGSSEALRPGDFSIAIGSPLGFDHTVTFGIISAVARLVPDINGNISFLQTDAAINPGNSGGPLLNVDGEVIGVNTAVQRNGQNIGFSIPIDVAKGISDDLIAGKAVLRPWIGISMREIDDVFAKSLGLPAGTKGVFVNTTVDNSPAKSAGILQSDIIQKIDGKPVATGKEIQDIVHAHKVKDTLNFFILRNNNAVAVPVIIGAYPDAPPTLEPHFEE